MWLDFMPSAGKPEESLSLIDALDEKTRAMPLFTELRAEIAADTNSTLLKTARCWSNCYNAIRKMPVCWPG